MKRCISLTNKIFTQDGVGESGVGEVILDFSAITSEWSQFSTTYFRIQYETLAIMQARNFPPNPLDRNSIISLHIRPTASNSNADTGTLPTETDFVAQY